MGWTEIQPANLYGAAMGGIAAGNQMADDNFARRDKHDLRQLAPGVANGDPEALIRATAINPDMAAKYDETHVALVKRAAGAAKYVMEGVSRGNQQELDGRMRAVAPYLTRLLGKPAPSVFDPSMIPHMEQLIATAQGVGSGANAEPAGYREFEMMTQGLSPEQKEQARRVHFGIEGRAATGGFGFKEVVGADGRTRMGRSNPRTGAFEVYNEQSGDFDPVGGTAPLNGGEAPPAQPQSGGSAQVLDNAYQGETGGGGQPFHSTVEAAIAPFGGRITSTTGGQHNAGSRHPGGGAVDVGMGRETPEQQAKILAALKSNPNLRVSDERQRPPGQKVWSGPHLHVESIGGQAAQAPGNPGLAVSRTKEEETAAVEEAKKRVSVQYDPQIAGAQEGAKIDANLARSDQVSEAEARAAAARKSAELDATNRAEVAALAGTRSRDADQTLVLLDEAEKFIGQSTGSRGGEMADETAAFFGKATEGAQAIAALQTIAGQLTSRMPRMQGPQSDKDVILYKQMAGDLANPRVPRESRKAALRTIRALNRKYATQSAPSQPKNDDSRRRALLDKY